MAEVIVEIHVPLEVPADLEQGDYPYPWIDVVEEFLGSLTGDQGEEYDDGEEVGSEYLFFVSGAPEQQLLALGQRVVELPGVPTGAYLTINDSDGGLGEGRRVDVGGSSSQAPVVSAGRDPDDLPPVPLSAWLSVHVNGAWDDDRPGEVLVASPYEDHLRYLASLLNKDQRWWDWWAAQREAGSSLWFWVEVGAVPGRRVRVRIGHDFAGREHVDVTLEVPAPELETPVTPVPTEASAPWPAVAARVHLDLLLSTVVDELGVEAPPAGQLPSKDTARLERERQQAEISQRRAGAAAQAEYDAWNRRRSSEHIWRGRAPDDEVDALIAAVRAGKRIVALPGLIAELRHRHDLPPAESDAARLEEAGYTPTEIATALG